MTQGKCIGDDDKAHCRVICPSWTYLSISKDIGQLKSSDMKAGWSIGKGASARRKLQLVFWFLFLLALITMVIVKSYYFFKYNFN